MPLYHKRSKLTPTYLVKDDGDIVRYWLISFGPLSSKMISLTYRYVKNGKLTLRI